MLRSTFLGGVLVIAALAVPEARQANAFLGAWNLNGTGQDAANVYWLDVKDTGGALSGLFLNRTGHPLPLAVVKIENGELIFQGGRPGAPTGPEYRATIEGGKLVGRHTVTQSAPASAAAPGTPPPAPTQRTVNWIGTRPPSWPVSDPNGKHAYGKPVVLYDAAAPPNAIEDIWGVQNATRPMNWSIDAAHFLANASPGGNNLVSKEKFTNFRVHVEYKLEPKSNSGLYLRGRYELQVLDDIADTTSEKFQTHAAIYGRTAPAVLASKAPGEWQTMEAVLVGNRVTVTLNGRKVHDNAVIGGITGGALDSDELAPGPLMIQGDHGRVWIRKVVVTPIVK